MNLVRKSFLQETPLSIFLSRKLHSYRPCSSIIIIIVIIIINCLSLINCQSLPLFISSFLSDWVQMILFISCFCWFLEFIQIMMITVILFYRLQYMNYSVLLLYFLMASPDIEHHVYPWFPSDSPTSCSSSFILSWKGSVVFLCFINILLMCEVLCLFLRLTTTKSFIVSL